MAIEEHIEVLRKGVQAWNSWRVSTPIQPDLSHITFCDKMHLSQGALLRNEGINLANVIFKEQTSRVPTSMTAIVKGRISPMPICKKRTSPTQCCGKLISLVPTSLSPM